MDKPTILKTPDLKLEMNLSLKNIYDKISKLDSLKPSSEVNFLFSQLVDFVTLGKSTDKLTDKETKNLRKICSKAEYELEYFWAEKIIESKDPKAKIKEFPYYQNYLELAHLEISSLKTCKIHTHHNNALFIGGGPIPLTAIVFAQEYNFNLTIIDSDQKAIKKSKELIESLNLQDKISIMLSKAEDFRNYSDFDIIFVASLVGNSTWQKKKVLKRINALSKKGTHVLARSVYGKRELLYSPLKEEAYVMYQPIVEIRPLNEIINSVIVLRST